ncbi:hypothetical protein N0V91_001523 [Didymella pomorum]|jgi:hypothetical protein|uniref:DUF7730 domain-containing protein n=1 Tax=Didymella pomorum TaxID=749634 RepID=A0A9W8ZNZ4_9PLEO|nr:hypothetical protein N0V91_001523 [Didymella pomorum]
MDPETALFARAHPRVKLLPKLAENAKSTNSSFLDMPGEIRNQIYQYYFQDHYRCELVGEGCDFDAYAPKALKQLSNTSQPMPSSTYKWTEGYRGSWFNPALTLRFPVFRAGRRSSYPGPVLYHGWLSPHGALILVCKQVCVETLPLLYNQITFIFEAPRRVENFLRRMPQAIHNSVTKLHLYYTTYGSPAAASDVTWQEKHIESWARACKAAAKSLTCLRELNVDVWINEDAPKFNLRQKWLQPLLQFRRLTCDTQKDESPVGTSLVKRPKTLTAVQVRLKTRLWAHDFNYNPPVAKACKDLHRLYGIGISKAMLGAKEDEAMDLFKKGWEGKHKKWRHHLGFASTGW